MEKKQKAIEANTKEDDEEPEDDETFDSRMIAVDWALSKDKWEEEKVKLETEQDEDAEMKDNSESDDSEEGNTSDSDEGDSDAIGLHEGDSDEGSGSDEDTDYDEDDAPVTGSTKIATSFPSASPAPLAVASKLSGTLPTQQFPGRPPPG